MPASDHRHRNAPPTLILRPAEVSDAAELVAANLRSRDFHAPWGEPFTDQAGFDAWLARREGGRFVGLVAHYAGEVAGVVNISEIVRGSFQSAYLGYYVMAGFEGRGLMTEAVRQAARYAFGELGLHRLEANIQPHNAASIALVRKLGFRLEGFSPRYLKIDGEWRDHERWALLADEFEGV